VTASNNAAFTSQISVFNLFVFKKKKAKMKLPLVAYGVSSTKWLHRQEGFFYKKKPFTKMTRAPHLFL
jgi:hypothetical protein